MSLQSVQVEPPICPYSRAVDMSSHVTSVVTKRRAVLPLPPIHPNMDNVIPPSAAVVQDALASLLHGAIELPLPTDNGSGDDFADERSDGEGNEVVQALGGVQGPDRDYPDLLDQGVPVLDEVPVPEIGGETPAAGRGSLRGRDHGLGRCQGC
eukprot:1422857-Rhodomonas_salina.1